jgi:hypothetical protein
VEEELAQERKKEVDQIIEKIKRTMTQQPVQTSKL